MCDGNCTCGKVVKGPDEWFEPEDTITNETPYTKGFRAGSNFKETSILSRLKADDSKFADWAIEFIKKANNDGDTKNN
jgi:hypothetical protein